MRKYYYYYFTEISCGVEKAGVRWCRPLKFSGSAPKNSAPSLCLRILKNLGIATWAHLHRIPAPAVLTLLCA